MTFNAIEFKRNMSYSFGPSRDPVCMFQTSFWKFVKMIGNKKYDLFIDYLPIFGGTLWVYSYGGFRLRYEKPQCIKF